MPGPLKAGLANPHGQPPWQVVEGAGRTAVEEIESRAADWAGRGNQSNGLGGCGAYLVVQLPKKGWPLPS